MKGEKLPSEKREIIDPMTGARVWQLTSSPGWSIAPYFTNTAFTPDSGAVAFHSDCSGKLDVYTVEIESGEITRLTDIPAEATVQWLRYFPDKRAYPNVICELVSWVERKVYFRAGMEFFEIDIDTLEERRLWEAPKEIVAGLPHMNAKGTHLVFPSMDRDIFGIPEEQRHSAQHFIWKRVTEDPQLQSYLLILDISTGKVEEWTKENAWFTHAQFSPIDMNKVLYCHEGVWEDVNDRMWLIDHGTDKKWSPREQTPDVCIGHEMWVPGSERILYHGWIGDDTMMGFVNADGSDRVDYREESRFYGHFCTNHDGSVIVTDAGIHKGVISLVTFQDGKMVFEPLCRHDNLWQHAWDHPHPHFSPDGRYILFGASHEPNTSNLYIVEVPEKYRK